MYVSYFDCPQGLNFLIWSYEVMASDFTVALMLIGRALAPQQLELNGRMQRQKFDRSQSLSPWCRGR